MSCSPHSRQERPLGGLQVKREIERRRLAGTGGQRLHKFGSMGAPVNGTLAGGCPLSSCLPWMGPWGEMVHEQLEWLLEHQSRWLCFTSLPRCLSELTSRMIWRRSGGDRPATRHVGQLPKGDAEPRRDARQGERAAGTRQRVPPPAPSSWPFCHRQNHSWPFCRHQHHSWPATASTIPGPSATASTISTLSASEPPRADNVCRYQMPTPISARVAR